MLMYKGIVHHRGMIERAGNLPHAQANLNIPLFEEISN